MGRAKGEAAGAAAGLAGFEATFGHARGRFARALDEAALASLQGELSSGRLDAALAALQSPESPLRSALESALSDALAADVFATATARKRGASFLEASGARNEHASQLVLSARSVLHVWPAGNEHGHDLELLDCYSSNSLTACGQRVSGAYRRADRGQWQHPRIEVRLCKRCAPHARGLPDAEESVPYPLLDAGLLELFEHYHHVQTRRFLRAKLNAGARLDSDAARLLATRAYDAALWHLVTERYQMAPRCAARRILGWRGGPERDKPYIVARSRLAQEGVLHEPESAAQKLTEVDWHQLLAVALPNDEGQLARPYEVLCEFMCKRLIEALVRVARSADAGSTA